MSWCSAECSESTGTIRAPVASASAITSSPPTTRLSLLASASSMPSLRATIVGPRPAEPTIALRTTSGSVAERSGRGSPPRPRARSRVQPELARRRGGAGVGERDRSGAGRLRLREQPLPARARRAGRRPGARASGRSRRCACSPIEPVEPRMRTSFTAGSVGTRGDRPGGAPSAELRDPVEDRVGDLALGAAREPLLAVRRMTTVTSLSALSKPIELSETSLTTIASIPLRSSLPRARSTKSPPCSAANPTRTWPSRRLAARPARTSAVGSSSSAEHRLPARARACARSGRGPEVGDRSGHQQDVAVGEGGTGRRLELGGAARRRSRSTPAARQRDVGGDQGHLGAAAGGGLGQGDAHSAARAVADEADRVDRLAGASRR